MDSREIVSCESVLDIDSEPMTRYREVDGAPLKSNPRRGQVRARESHLHSARHGPGPGAQSDPVYHSFARRTRVPHQREHGGHSEQWSNARGQKHRLE
jgi:hypothetical protein